MMKSLLAPYQALRKARQGPGALSSLRGNDHHTVDTTEQAPGVNSGDTYPGFHTRNQKVRINIRASSEPCRVNTSLSPQHAV